MATGTQKRQKKDNPVIANSIPGHKEPNKRNAQSFTNKIPPKQLIYLIKADKIR